MELADHPTIRVAACDLNGQMRGKRIPGAYALKLDAGAVRMPLSVLNVDIFGADIEGSPLVFDSGDADGVLYPTGRGPVPLPWLDAPQPLVPMAMHHEDGTPFEGDPRHALVGVLDRFGERGWQVIAATELEFTLVDDSGEALRHVRDPRSGRRLEAPGILSMAQMDAFDPFLTALYEACAAMGIPAQTATSEAGIGQFEVTLDHQDALRAADDTWLFKTLIKGLAHRHGFSASFMAKPFSNDAGNGMHLHFSVLDGDGRNVFDDGGAKGTDTLRAAVAGCLAALPASTLVFAPHANSYARLVPGSHAPISAAWAYENRTAALRIPGGPPAARRIEHRAAGGDINPYLSFATILGAAITGVEEGMEPPDPITGNAYEHDLPRMASDWEAAIDRFEGDPLLATFLPRELIANLVMTKRQELRLMRDIAPEAQWKTYLETV
ncbi:glutamate--putrescine ligase [Roseovarius halotolerans]|uniref:Gamma-glutamylputrescine synthetase PuuA n=1 Tax=Roseovarius halotolerans TaxID=505353 RepID=A0A1X6ZA07_9RHOB|nr:glutamine synthetase family protein [Roseovarius halotolerans]RKT30513.1 glutamate--putrescine ligase [Roseovarius halotolerans]SLN45193.1 Gamma-glutamylputrescine synthetase PuuA [Roseovarius halotolerans]